jgi:hypothetical protein
MDGACSVGMIMAGRATQYEKHELAPTYRGNITPKSKTK